MSLSMLLGLASGSGSTNALLYVIGALLAGGLLNFVYQVWRRWRWGPIEDKKTIEDTIQSQVTTLRGLISEYRTEAEVTKRLLGDYREQLNELTKDLAKAQVRIGYLEDELRSSRDRRSEIERDLHLLQEERKRMEVQRDRLLVESDQMRERIAQLEALSGLTEKLTHHEEPPD